MHPKARFRVPASLDVIPFSAPPGDLSWVRCLDCSEELTLHQPDTEDGDRILGICEGCKLWFLIDLMPGQAEAVVVVLPGVGLLMGCIVSGGLPSATLSP